MEPIAADAAAAEHHLRQAYEAFRAMGERGYLSAVAGSLAEAPFISVLMPAVAVASSIAQACRARPSAGSRAAISFSPCGGP
jgi:hypothetical protein